MKDLGRLHHFLGVKVIQDQFSGSIWIGQPSYIDKLLQTSDMNDSKPVASSVNCDVKLIPCDNSEDVYNQQRYQAVVGSLLYLSTKTRPDIAFAVARWLVFVPTPQEIIGQL